MQGNGRAEHSYKNRDFFGGSGSKHASKVDFRSKIEIENMGKTFIYLPSVLLSRLSSCIF